MRDGVDEAGTSYFIEMEFGRVATIEGIDLRLPPDHPDTARVLRTQASGGNASTSIGDVGAGSRAITPTALRTSHGKEFTVHVGLPVWNDRGIASRLSPMGIPANQRLECYAGNFNAIELNSSGYALSASNAAAWAAKTPSGFLFYPKVPRTITHGGDLAGAGGLFREFCRDAAAFGDRLGTGLLQFSEDFGPSRFGELDAFLRAHSGSFRLAVEVRHRGWFSNARAREAYFELLAGLGVIAVILHVPGRRDLLHQRLTSPHVLVRFSGHDRSGKDRARLEEWVARLKTWRGLGLRSATFFFHSVPEYLSVDWAVDFVVGVNRELGLDLKVPGASREMEPQLDLFGAT